MVHEASFPDLMERLRRGDDVAAAVVFRRFVGRLVALAHAQLDSWLRRKEDPEDVIQSVYRSFFHRVGNGQFDLDGWHDLWALLARITLRKCANRCEHYRTQARDAWRERPLTSPLGSGADRPLVDREPTPLEAAALTDTVADLLRRLEPPERAIVELTLQGCSSEEIAARLGRARRTVQRVREHVKVRLLRD